MVRNQPMTDLLWDGEIQTQAELRGLHVWRSYLRVFLSVRLHLAATSQMTHIIIMLEFS